MVFRLWVIVIQNTEIFYRTTIYHEFSKPYSLAILYDKMMVPNTVFLMQQQPWS